MTWFSFPISHALTVVAALLIASAGLAADEVRVRVATGVDFTSGDYGGAQDIEDTYIPVTVTADTGRLGFRLTVPYLRVRAPTGTVSIGPGGDPTPGSGPLRTEGGMGDVVGAMTLYDVISDPERGIAVDLTAKIKFATADEQDGLGTGENDYSIQADLYKYYDALTVLAGAGYKVRGDPSGLDLQNGLFATLGGFLQLAPQTRVGLLYDFRESAFDSADDIQELTGVLSQQLSEQWRVQFHALAGLSDSSPDWGTGFLIKYAF